MPEGDVRVLLEARPKNPMTTSPGAVVLTEGALTDRVSGVNAPLCESIGAVTSIPLKSRIAPTALAVEDQDQV